MASPKERELSQEEVERRLAVYDISKNPRLVKLYPPNQYPHTRRCAVLVPLFFAPSSSSSTSSSPRSELHVLLTLRSSSLSSHADTAAFPGGAQDPTDPNDTTTALREAHEEVGLQPSDVKVLAKLPPFFVRKSNSVFPVVGFIPPDFRPTPNEQEVSRVFSVPLRKFAEEGQVVYREYPFFGETMRVGFLTHVVDNVPIVVWGFTCQVCVCVAHAILGPFRRLPLIVRGGEGEGGGGGDGKGGGSLLQKVEGGASDGGGDDDDDSSGGGVDEHDSNVFRDVETVYHLLCNATRPSGRL